jgi:hypothetical protein
MIQDPITTQLPAAPATSVYGRDGDQCPHCGAALAGDQRYCLHCGLPRREARHAFLDVLGEDARVATAFAPPAAPPPAAHGGLEGWLRDHSAVLGLGGLLLVTLLIGLLVGHWATGSAPEATRAPAPQVIRIAGGAAPAAAAGATDAGGAGTGSGAGAGKGASKAKSSNSVPKGAVSVDKLSKLKPNDYKKQVEKAVKKGKPISTGGAPPPKDDKPAGNGTTFETIG